MADHKPPTYRHAAIATAYFLLSGLFSYAFYERYWKWRTEIGESASSFVTPDGANLVSGGQFWAVPALLFLVAAGWRLIRHFRGR